MSKFEISLAIGLLLLGSSRSASAIPAGPPIRVVLQSCGDIREDEVERIVGAELGNESNADEESDPTWIVVSCAGGRVLIEVGDVVSRKTLRRSFDFGKASPKSRARLIAIAASELVLASWSELALRPRLRVEPEGLPPSRARAEAARSRAESVKSTLGDSLSPEWPPMDALPIARPRQRWLDELPPERRRFRISGLASVRGFFGTQGSLWGGGLRISDERLVLTSWALDALYETGAFTLGARKYSIDSWSLGGMLYFYGRASFVTARVGAGLRAGLTAVSVGDGTLVSSPSTRILTPWGWPMLTTGLSFGLKPLSVELGAEGGYVAVPLATASQGGVSLRGIWFGAQLGLSLVL